MLPRAAIYFLDWAVEIFKIDYEPSDMDIMYAEGITLSKSFTSMEFLFPKLAHEDSLDTKYQHDSSLRLKTLICWMNIWTRQILKGLAYMSSVPQVFTEQAKTRRTASRNSFH